MVSSCYRINSQPFKWRNGACRRANGFTLIELMIVVLVLAVLMAIAYPSYEAHVTKTRRAVAGSCALEAAQFMERYYTTHMSYLDTAGAAPALPAGQCAAELQGHYTVSLAAGTTASAYTIQAVPVPGSRQAAKDTKCATLTIDETGAKGVSNTATDPSECW